MKEEVKRRLASLTTTLLVAVLTAYEVAVGIPLLRQWEPATTLLLLAGLLLLVLYTAGPLEYLTWRSRTRWVRARARVGILDGSLAGEKGRVIKQPIGSRFPPEAWKDRLATRHKAKLIPASKLSGAYALILNPWGEVYPETDLHSLKMLTDIFRYVENGGMFMSVGGIPFFYAWDYSLGRPVPTGEEIQFLTGRSTDPLILGPAYANVPLLSLSRQGTVVGRLLGLSLTTGDAERLKVTQEIDEERLVGELATTGGTRYVRGFRSVRKTSRQFIPLLRADHQGLREEVYPLVALGYGRGYFIFAGMDLKTEEQADQTDTARSGFEKCCVAVERVLRNWK